MLCLLLPYRLSSLQTRILLCTVSRQTSLTDFTPVDFHDLLLRRIRPPPLCSALIARLSNCHFLRQIVLSRVGVTDTRIKLAEEKKREGAKGEGEEEGEGRVLRTGDTETSLGGCLL